MNTQELAWEDSNVKGVTARSLMEHQCGTFKMIKLAPGATYPVHVHPKKTEFAYVI